VGAQVDTAKFLELWSNGGLRRRVGPGTATQNWMLGRRIAYDEAVELAAAAATAGIYCLASAS